MFEGEIIDNERNRYKIIFPDCKKIYIYNSLRKNKKTHEKNRLFSNSRNRLRFIFHFLPKTLITSFLLV